MEHLPDQTFCLRGENNSEEWFAYVEGRTFGPWRDKPAAEAGKDTERNRANARAEKARQDQVMHLDVR